MRLGQLTTLNTDPYFDEMPDAEWFAQVWVDLPGGGKSIVARFYGASPDEARKLASDYVHLFSPPPQEET